MGEGAAPGKKPLVDADKVTRGTDDNLAPGKRALPQGPAPVGDPFVDQGAANGPDSFLTDGQRTRLINAFQQRSLVAESNYQDAAGDVRVDKLLAKDDNDLPWIASLLIDLALGHIVGKIATSLIALKDAQGAKLKKVMEDAILFQQPDPPVNWKSRAQTAVSKLTDANIKSAVGTATALGKTRALAGITAGRGVSGANKKQDALSFLEQLRDAASIAFQHFRELTPATSNDGELVALFATMDVKNHLISQYKVAIEEKLERFEASKVTKVGRRYEDRDMFSDGVSVSHGEEAVVRDVWVQWQTYESGYPIELVFRHQDSHRALGTIHKDEPGVVSTPMERKSRRPVEAPENGISNDPKAIYVVPAEFRETALLRHKQMWGKDAETVMIDDESYMTFDPVRATKARENKAAKAKVPKVQLAAKPASTPVAPPKEPVVVPDAFKDVDTTTGKKRSP